MIRRSKWKIAASLAAALAFGVTSACEPPGAKGERGGERGQATGDGQEGGTRAAVAGAGAGGKDARQWKDPLDVQAPDDVAAPPAEAARTASGLASKVLQPGTGTGHPSATDLVHVRYTCWAADGRMLSRSPGGHKLATFRMDEVIAGWAEGLTLMVAGEKRRLWIPERLAYGGRPDGPQGMLVFDVEMVGFVKPPETPADVAAVPGGAKTTASGLASKVLEKGAGKKHPNARSVVTVDFTGWTTDGKMFGSTVTSGNPVQLSLENVIAGWAEGLTLMVEGERRRLWIPEELAYRGEPGYPAGMLVFDVELLAIAGGGSDD